MKSFPSTLNRGGSNLQITNVPSSIKDTRKNSWSAAVNAGKSSMTSGEGLDTEGIRYNDDPDKASLLDHTNITDASELFFQHKSITNGSGDDIYNNMYEDSLHIPFQAIDVANKYKVVVRTGPIEYSHKPTKDGASDKPTYTQYSAAVAGSLFNPYWGVLSTGVTPSTPLMLNQTQYYGSSSDDCTIANLVKLSSQKVSILGQARYKYADFMYCRDLGKISNNHLITLRRFTTPVSDNIFTDAAIAGSKSDWAMMGDVGRMVTWFGNEENKLEDIMRYDYEATWKELKSEIQQEYSQEDDGLDAPGTKNVTNKLVALTGQQFWKSVAKGTNGSITVPFLGTQIEAGLYQRNDAVLGKNYDKNKIYEPKNTMRTMNVYEGELKFNHEFNIVFNYKLRAFDNINPKAAFLDLLANILMTTYRRGEFWGGDRQVLGTQRNTKGWNVANNIIQKGGEMAKEFIQQLAGGGDGAGSLLASIIGGLTNAGNFIVNAAGEGINKLKKMWKDGSIKKWAPDVLNNVIDGGMGLLKNHLGRPAVYCFHSLLTGEDTGLWHVTIGNPLNPIAAFGNLIMTKAVVQHFGPLGVDDFPTELKVTVTLKHARPRDAFGIQKMYTKGGAPIYQTLSAVTDPSEVYNFSAMGANKKPRSKFVTTGGPKIQEDGTVVIEPVTISVVKGLNGPLTGADIEVDDNFQASTPDSFNYLGDWDMQRIQTNRLQLA